jgi:glycerophosphoryl diester phosphodiesterase
VTPRFLEAAHGVGVRVDVWTIDEPAEMRRLLDLGVDVVMTNRPEALAGVLRGRGLYTLANDEHGRKK